MAFVVVVFTVLWPTFLQVGIRLLGVCFLKIGGNRTVGRRKIGSEQPWRLRRKAAVIQEGKYKENIPYSGHANKETEQLLRVEEEEKGSVSPCVCLAGYLRETI